MQKLSGRSGRIKIGASIAFAATTPIVITSKIATVTTIAAHGLLAGMFVLISGVVGMTDANNKGKGFVILTAPTTTSFTVALDSSQTYTSGGTVQRIIPISEWAIDASSAVGGATDSESGDWKDKVPGGERDWKGTYSGFDYDGAGIPPLDEGHDAEFDVDAHNSWTGNAVFNSFKTNAKVAGAAVVTMDGGFEGNGELVRVHTT